jgi:hypothetical protein
MNTVATSRAVPGAWSGERTFHVALTLAILGAVLLGFARSFYLRPLFPDHPAPPEAFFTLHGVVFTAWFVLLPVQALLIAGRRPDLHRMLGAVGVALAVALVPLGVYGALVAVNRPGGFIGVPIPAWSLLIVPLTGMLLFATFVVLAIARRRDAASHKRWMLLASIAMLPAACARWPGVVETGNPLVFFALANLFLVPLIVRDRRTRGRLHPATLWGSLVLVLSVPLQLGLAMTPAWEAVARSLMRLVA